MAETNSLIELQYGGEAKSDELNSNFQYLDDRITFVKGQLDSKLNEGYKNSPNGVCPLDGNSKVPKASLNEANTPADNDNSNKIATTAFVKKATDGRWVKFAETEAGRLIFDETNLQNDSSTDLLKKVNVPNDGRTYEVLFDGRIIKHANKTNSHTPCLKLGTNKLGIKTAVCGIDGDTEFARGAIILPISYEADNLRVQRASNWYAKAKLYAIAYRRMGVNT